MTSISLSARVEAIEYYLPPAVVTNEDLARQFPDWTAERIEDKLGIRKRHVAATNECASDLGVRAAERLLTSGACTRQEIDYLLFCTQSPDYFLPTTACLLQERLNLPKRIGALDFNLGCSGFVYGLGLAKGLIETGQARKVLLVTAETYTKYLHPEDKSVRTLFGDAGAATLVSSVSDPAPRGGLWMGPFVFGTDGSGAGRLIVRAGASRSRASAHGLSCREVETRPNGDSLHMDGPSIFSFTLSVVHNAVNELLARAGCELGDIDLSVFHQASRHMLDALRRKCEVPLDRFVVHLQDCVNTVSCTIPIALKESQSSGRLTPGSRVMIVGFGVGFSWGAALLRWG